MQTKINDLRERVSLQTCTVTPDELGGYTEGWVDSKLVWANIVHKSAATYQVTMRGGVAVDSDMRLGWLGKQFTIADVVVDGKQQWIKFLITEV